MYRAHHHTAYNCKASPSYLTQELKKSICILAFSAPVAPLNTNAPAPGPRRALPYSQ